MINSKKLKNLKDKIIMILENDLESRNSDERLYLEVCKLNGVDVSNISFEEAMLNKNLYNIPSFTSVERVRRKAQELRPDLIGINKSKRDQLQNEYIDFAMNTKN